MNWEGGFIEIRGGEDCSYKEVDGEVKKKQISRNVVKGVQCCVVQNLKIESLDKGNGVNQGGRERKVGKEEWVGYEKFSQKCGEGVSRVREGGKEELEGRMSGVEGGG